MRLNMRNRIALKAIPILIVLAGSTADAQMPEPPIIWQFDTGG